MEETDDMKPLVDDDSRDQTAIATQVDRVNTTRGPVAHTGVATEVVTLLANVKRHQYLLRHNLRFVLKSQSYLQ